MILLLLSNALAAELSWEAQLQGASGIAPSSSPYSLGAGVSAGAWLSPRVSLDGLVQLGLAQPRVDIRPELRVFLTPADASWGALHLSAGYGVALLPSLAPFGAVGVGLDLPTPWEGLGMRIQTRYLVAGVQPQALQLSLGLYRRPQSWQQSSPPPPLPQPLVVPDPTPPEPLLAAQPLPPSAEWIPYPVCEWLPPEQAEQARQSVDAQLGGVPPGAGELVVLEPSAPSMGSVIVVSRPGDVVRVSDQELSVGSQGLLVLAAPPGRLDLELAGAGQHRDYVVSVASDHVVWVRGDTLPLPEALRVHYPGGSRTMSASERAALDDFVTLLGDWQVQVQGLYSPDGSLSANLALADSRARAARQALIDAGIPAERIEVLPPPDAAPAELSTADQRAAVITPVIPGDSP